MNDNQLHLKIKMDRNDLCLLVNCIDISDHQYEIFSSLDINHSIDYCNISYDEYYKAVRNVVSKVHNLLSETASEYYLTMSKHEYKIVLRSLKKYFIKEINNLLEVINILKCNVIIDRDDESSNLITKVTPVVNDLSDIEKLYNKLLNKEETQ